MGVIDKVTDNINTINTNKYKQIKEGFYIFVFYVCLTFIQFDKNST